MSESTGPFRHQDGNTYFTNTMGRMLTADLILDNEHHWVAAVFQDELGPEKQFANAKILAASWDMLHALKDAKNSVEDLCKMIRHLSDDGKMDAAPWLDLITKAIAKAEEPRPPDPEFDKVWKDICKENGI